MIWKHRVIKITTCSIVRHHAGVLYDQQIPWVTVKKSVYTPQFCHTSDINIDFRC